MVRKLVFVILVLGLALVAGLVVWFVWQPQWIAGLSPTATPSGSRPPSGASITVVPAPLTKEGIPAKLSELNLVDSKIGPDAMSEFAQLHGEGFDLKGGYRANYSDGTSQATLWVGQAKDVASAQAMTDAMADKIGQGNNMFQDLQTLNIGGRKLYTAVGQEQQHFFYGVNDKIVWLAADPDVAADVLHSLWGAVK